MADSEAIAQFVGVTGSTPEQATQFLGAANGDVQQALSTFFEVQAGEQDDEQDAGGAAMPGTFASAAPAEPQDDSSYTGPRTLDGKPVAGGASWPSASASSSSSRPPRRTGIATLNSGGSSSAGAFRQGASMPESHSDDEHEHHSSEDDDDDKGQDLYAGGGRSGLNVEDPNKRKSGRKMVDEILKKASENSSHLEPQAPAPSGPTWFGGSANTLGSDETPSQSIVPPGQPGDDDPEANEEVVTRHLTLWSNGFSINDGPLLSYQEHSTILQDLNQGRAPLQLLNVKFGQRVDLQVQKRMEEEYVPQKPTMKAFEGSGNRLGAPAPDIGGSSSASPAAGAAAQTSSSSAMPTKDPESFMTNPTFELDQSQPVTSIQIRTGSGERIVGRFNHTHTIGDVMGYINASQPGAGARPYVLQTTFPNRDLTDLSQTVKDAGLLSSVVVCRNV